MSKLDVYLRSIERFGAAGAVLTSGQAVTLRFPTGDRHATQVTPHDQLVIMVREIAPPAALDAIDKQRPARFDIESQGTRYSISVQPRPGAWQVEIAPGHAAAPAPAPAPAAPSRPPGRAPSAPVDAGGEMTIERGQYDMPADAAAPPATSGSGFLDQLTQHARGVRATDIYLATGAPPLVRAGADIAPTDRGPIDADQLSREVGIVAPPSARAAWVDGAPATFAYGDGAGRVRVTLTRDRRGPAAALRLLHGEPPALERLSLGAEVTRWLGERGLIVIAGASNVGKTTLLAALVRALGERKRHVVSIEDPIEIVQSGATISQREVGEHVPSFAAGVASAMREGADAIVLGAVATAEAAQALVDAVAGGHLVLTTVTGEGKLALSRLLSSIPGGEKLCLGALLGTITPAVARSGGRTYEVSPP
ncbi:MAG: ATPase, T2SS/T4P/T4SS family [Kofleriaceae bacterium]